MTVSSTLSSLRPGGRLVLRALLRLVAGVVSMAALLACSSKPDAPSPPREPEPPALEAGQQLSDERPFLRSQVQVLGGGRWVFLCRAEDKETELTFAHHGAFGATGFIVDGKTGAARPVDTLYVGNETCDSNCQATGQWPDWLNQPGVGESSVSSIVFVADGALQLQRADAPAPVQLAPLSALPAYWGRSTPQRLAALDPTGEHLTWLEERGEAVVAMMMDLGSGERREVPLASLGQRRVMELSLSPGGRWLSLATVPRMYQRVTDPAYLNYCGMGYHAESPPEPHVVFMPSGKDADEGALTWLGPHLVRRTSDGAIRVEDEQGTLVFGIPAACQARVVWGHHESQRLLAHCLAGDHAIAVYSADGVAHVAVMETSGRKVTPFGQSHPDILEWSPQQRLLTVGRPGSSVIVDFQTGQTHPLDRTDGVWATFEDRALVRRSTDAQVIDVNTMERTTVARDVDRYARPLSAGRYTAVDGYVFDLKAATVHGRYDGRAYAMSPDGRVVIGPRDPGDEQPRGPLFWYAPPER